MRIRRLAFHLRAHVAYRLDQALGWPPVVQLPALVALTTAIVAFWAGLLFLLAPGAPPGDPLWWSLSRFLDGGTMAQDTGWRLRAIAIGATASGVTVVSLLTGAFASKMAERIAELRSGASPAVVRRHVLVLGYDPKVPLLARELARSRQRVQLVVLAQEDKARLELTLRTVRQTPHARVRIACRTGDPRSELALLRVYADRARAIVVIPPADVDDDRAVRWTLSTLLALRRAVGDAPVPVIVEARRATHAALLILAGEDGVAGEGRLDVRVVASDDLVARVLAQSVRHGGVYFALQELMSFHGSELYVVPVPAEFVGHDFDHAHARLGRGIVLGVLRSDGSHLLAPPCDGALRLAPDDRLVVLAPDHDGVRVVPALPAAPAPPGKGSLPPEAPARVVLLGANRTLPCLIAELDKILPMGSTLRVVCPALADADEAAVEQSSRACAQVSVERDTRSAEDASTHGEALVAGADAVVVLGYEDETDPDGDASALATLLRLRHASRQGRLRIERIVTEVRDPSAAAQVSGTANDFLVSTDVIATVLAQEALAPEGSAVRRELLGPDGVEIQLHPRRRYLPAGRHTFAEAMAAARAHGEVAIGLYPHAPEAVVASARERFEQGLADATARSFVWLDPPRDALVPTGDDACLVVLGRGPRALTSAARGAVAASRS